jgi:hypothetical protein
LIKIVLYRAAIASLLMSTPVAMAQVSSGQSRDRAEAEKEVLAIDARRIDALLRNDVALLESITDENYIRAFAPRSAVRLISRSPTGRNEFQPSQRQRPQEW